MIASWEKVKNKISMRVPEHCYRIWIDPVTFIGSGGNTVQLSCPNSFYVKRLKDNYLSLFEQEFSNQGHENIKIEFSTGQKAGVEKARGQAPVFPVRNAVRPKQMALPGLDKRFGSGRLFKKGFTFDQFVKGDHCEFAYSAARSLARGGENGPGVLYLSAKTGLGKSHLSQAVGHHIVTKDQARKVFYMTAEDFTNEMIFSLRNNTIRGFKEKYRKQCDFLILEDVHFLSGKTATQTELAAAFDYLLDADKKIIFSGGIGPDEIPKLNDRLRSRLSMGLVTGMSEPGFAARVAILKKKSKALGHAVPGEVIEYIAGELSGDVRRLESGLYGVAAKGRLLEKSIDLALARSVIETMPKPDKGITSEHIKHLVCDQFPVSKEELVSGSRKRRIVKPRQVAMYLTKKYTDLPLNKIARSFNRYHATVVYSINAVEKEIRQKGVLFEQVNFLSKKIETGRVSDGLL